GGELAHMITTLFGEDPGPRIEEDLTRLKDAMVRAHEDRDGLQPATVDALGYEPLSPEAETPRWPATRRPGSPWSARGSAVLLPVGAVRMLSPCLPCKLRTWLW